MLTRICRELSLTDVRPVVIVDHIVASRRETAGPFPDRLFSVRGMEEGPGLLRQAVVRPTCYTGAPVWAAFPTLGEAEAFRRTLHAPGVTRLSVGVMAAGIPEGASLPQLEEEAIHQGANLRAIYDHDTGDMAAVILS